MAKNDFQTLSGPADAAITTQTTSVVRDISHLKANTVNVGVTGITTGTVKVQISNDGTTFVTAPGATATLTADGCYALPVAAKFVRLNVTVATTVAIIGSIGGESLIG